ncbi:MAG: helix-turn-helix domain-containing protein [Bacteroidota bacterium]
MLFYFNEKSSWLLVFFVHGLVFTFLLLKKGLQNKDQANLWLASFVLLCSLYICPFMLGYAGWYSDNGYRDFMFYVPFQQLFFLGPIIYFYTQNLLNPSFRLQREGYIHFLPGTLYLCYSLVVLIGDKLVLKAYYFYADGRDKDLDAWYQWAGLFSMVFYLILSLRHYNNYRKLAFETLSFAESVLFRWIQRYLIAFLIILLLRVLFFILNPEWGQFGNKFWYYLCFSILFYYITISGYANAIQNSLSMQQFFSKKDRIIPIEKFLITASTSSKIATDQLPELQVWKSKLAVLMKEKELFKTPTLTLTDVASDLSTTPKQVSQIVNQGFDLNFNDFVNQYRVEEVIKQFEQGKHQERTLLAIALESGFNSKATFNRAFKKHKNSTPQQYLSKMGRKVVENRDL